MTDILLSIFCSTSIILLFKQLGKLQVDSLPVIALNYLVCVAMALLLNSSSSMQSLGSLGDLMSQSWWPMSVVIGLLFVGSFELMAICTRKNGIAATAVANKLSMAAPIAVAFYLYGDAVNFWKVSGILLALPAVVLASFKSDNTSRRAMWLPLVVWMVAGMLDIMMNYAQHYYLGMNDFNSFLLVIFGVAAILAILWVTVSVLRGTRKVPPMSTVVWALLLGIPNYGSVYFLLRALESSGFDSSSVFPLINISIVGLSALLGWLIFSERLKPVNLAGLFLSFVVILFIALGSQ